MQRSDFNFELPEALIAQFPAKERAASRLLCLERASGQLTDRQFSELPELLRPGDLLVLNDTRVIPARLYGHKTTGGKLEVLVERVVSAQEVLAQVRASKSPRPGSRLHFDGGFEAEVMVREGDLFRLRFLGPQTVEAILAAIGHMPLPPYISRAAEGLDAERYQTVYARRAGAVAAPTAGLHFDQAMLVQLSSAGVGLAYVTLHVGAGTFQPVRVDDINAHRMHAEWLEVSPAVCAQVEATRQQGGRVIAVGTTAVRSLETAGQSGNLQPFRGETEIFITPGYRFKVVDALLTNFHLPESTLLMLVCALGGYEQVMHAYQHAVAQQYRFFSYGDAMLIY